jgi:hypothetical protein
VVPQRPQKPRKMPRDDSKIVNLPRSSLNRFFGMPVQAIAGAPDARVQESQ